LSAQDVSIDLYACDADVTWCPGCGDFSVLRALKRALVAQNIQPHEALVVSGIGCGSKLPDYLHTNGFMTIHGRPLAIATGAHLANPDLRVIVVNGDGDSYGIGGNHFVHTCRRNPDITQIVENNAIYGLTKGQYSPTSRRGIITSTSPEGSIEMAFNPVTIAIAAGAGFVARSFAGDPRHLESMIIAGMNHHGYALIDVLQPCVTFNRTNSYEWYRDRVYDLKEASHDPSNRDAAWVLAHEWGDHIPIGLIYEGNGERSYADEVSALKAGNPAAAAGRLAADPHPEAYERLKKLFS
jgi:2-oxoglutarate ferredoxin oxidoreductase subunit beta